MKGIWSVADSINISETLNLILKKRGWSVYKMAKEADVSEATAYNSCKGNTIPRVDVLERMCTGLGITLLEFMEIAHSGKEVFYYTRKEKQLVEMTRQVSSSKFERIESYVKGLIDSGK